MEVLRRLESHTGLAQTPEKLKPLAFACVGVFLANAIFASVLFDSRGLHDISSYWRGEKRTGLAVGRITQQGSLIIVADGQMDDFSPDRSMTPPDVFYFSDRRGWYVALSWLRPELIEKLKDQGGRYFVITGNALAEFTASYRHIEGYLSGRYTRILESTEGYVYDLSLVRSAEAMH
jgi:hypothetical protein